MKKLLFLLFVYLLGVVYLSLPHPSELPSLSDLQSDEPGDTWQNPNQKAFFTNKNRSQVLLELQDKFALNIFGFKYKGFRLNYRPEESGVLVRDQIMTNYLEEIIHPFRESIFVNGWEPTNSPIYKGYLSKDIPGIHINGQNFISKVTIRPQSSQTLPRLIIWTLCFPSLYLLYKTYQYIKNV